MCGGECFKHDDRMTTENTEIEVRMMNDRTWSENVNMPPSAGCVVK